MKTATLKPAYGRKYTNKAQVEADLKANKDFVLTGYFGSGYVNLADLKGFADSVQVYYDNACRKSAFLKL